MLFLKTRLLEETDSKKFASLVVTEKSKIDMAIKRYASSKLKVSTSAM